MIRHLGFRSVAALAAVLGIALGGLATASAVQADGDPASDVGITAKEIRIAVVADVDNSFRPGLFAASPAAVQAFAKYINKSGGLAGRKLVVDFIDSHMSPDDARSAVQQACEEDFALVGTGALFLNSVEDMVNCVDKAGEATGIPDIPIVTTEIAQQCSPVSFPINAPQLICGTQDQTPQTFQGNVGGFFYYQKHRGADLHGINVYVNDLKSSAAAAKVLGGSAEAEGIEIEQIPMSALATQAEFTPLIQRAEQADANFIANAGAYQTSVKMRREAKLQGLDVDNIVWDCASNCYDEKLIQEGGSDVEDQYARIYQLPFSEAKHSPALAAYLKNTPKDKIDGFGAYAWVGAVLFRDAVNTAVEKHGENGLTRKAVLEALNDTHEFDADNMWGTADIGNREFSPCYVLMQVRNGKFVRVHPKKAGTFDCKPRNTISFKADYLNE